jgi:hypothetical protein
VTIDASEFKKLLGQRREEAVHQYLCQNSEILIRAFFPNEPFLCLSKFRFGTDFVSDFLLVKLWSTVTDILLVELEPAYVHPFNRDGNYSQRLNGALQQITEWSAWIRENRQFFHDSILRKAEQVSPSCLNSLRHRIRYDLLRSKIVIGRRTMMSERDDARRASLYLDSRGGIEIVPYDRLLDVVLPSSV